MVIVDDIKALTRPQRSAFFASWLGWALDAFDYFLLTLMLTEIAKGFHVDVPAVSWAVTFTLVARPIGALIFGRLADRYGRRPIMMINVGAYSLLALASAFSPNLITLIALRALFGVAMGGMWGIGASLALESIPPKSRGVVSGILQQGYPVGALLAAMAFLISPIIGWRGMLALGALPALLILYVRARVPESPVWQARHAADPHAHRQRFLTHLRGRWGLLAYVVLLMTAFNFFSHGTQDGYATFLKAQHHFTAPMVSLLNVVLNLGAITGGIIFGTLSERLGRRRAIALAALLSLPMIPLWAYSATPLMLGAGAFLIQIAVQGAWGVVPAHLNELSPPGARGAFPGFAYQLGNVFAAATLTLETTLAVRWGGNYSQALAAVTVVTAVVLAVVAWFGPEAKGVAFEHETPVA